MAGAWGPAIQALVKRQVLRTGERWPNSRLAKVAEVSPNTITKILKGGDTQTSVLLRIAAALGATWEEVSGRDLISHTDGVQTSPDGKEIETSPLHLPEVRHNNPLRSIDSAEGSYGGGAVSGVVAAGTIARLERAAAALEQLAPLVDNVARISRRLDATSKAVDARAAKFVAARIHEQRTIAGVIGPRQPAVSKRSRKKPVGKSRR